MLKNQTKPWIITTLATLATLVGPPAFAESSVIVGAAAWRNRLFLKSAEGFIDAITKALVTEASAPAAREEYDLGSRPTYYEDEIFGVYHGGTIPYRFRRAWIDPMGGGLKYETWIAGALQDREAFYYTLHNRNYTCLGPSTQSPRDELHVRAKSRYQIFNSVVKPDPANGVWSHPVRWKLALKLLPASCQDTTTLWDLEEVGQTNLPRGGGTEISSWFPNVDILYCLNMYDQK